MLQLGPWICDTCGNEVMLDEGYAVWADTPQGEADFRIIHNTAACDPGDTHTHSIELSRFVGSDGLSYVMSLLSLGPINARHGNKPRTPRVGDFDGFVDFVRRVQVPGYEQARQRFDDPKVLEQYEGHTEWDPYMREALEQIAGGA